MLKPPPKKDPWRNPMRNFWGKHVDYINLWRNLLRSFWRRPKENSWKKYLDMNTVWRDTWRITVFFITVISVREVEVLILHRCLPKSSLRRSSCLFLREFSYYKNSETNLINLERFSKQKFLASSFDITVAKILKKYMESHFHKGVPVYGALNLLT